MKQTGLKRLLCGVVMAVFVSAASGQMVFRNAVTGEELDLTEGREEGRDTPALKEFFQTGINPYNEDEEALVLGESLFNTACSACHGYTGAGNIGPALNSGNWDYELHSDKGLFEVVFGGAERQMGPQYEVLTQDEMLYVMAWVRHLYTGPAEDTEWFSDEQRSKFTPYEAKE